MLRHQSGQASLFLIILSAIALILFAVTMNWGRIAQFKNKTMVAATTASAQIASGYASYSEMQMRTQLGGKFEKCKHNSIFGAILTLILVVVIAIVAPPAAGAIAGMSLSTVAVTLAAANLVLQVAVVQPGLTRMWNKLQQDAGLSTIETFLSNGLVAALQGVVTDTAQITDYFDSNTDGKLGFNTETGLPFDTTARFAFYNTEYLRGLKSTRSNINIDNFTGGLDTYLKQIVNPTVNAQDPRYNPCCLPLMGDDGPLRPGISTCPDQSAVPAACNGAVWSGNPYFYGNTYSLAYDAKRPKYDNPDNSFLAQFGIDEEVRPFNASKSTETRGIFSALWDMDRVRDASFSFAPLAIDVNNPKRSMDKVDKIEDYKAADNICVDSIAPEEGLNWKPGKDTYCRTQWPYDQCVKYECEASTAENGGNDCCTTTAAAAGDWPEDLLDQTIDDLKEFYGWGRSILAMEPAVAAANMAEWYDNSKGDFSSGKDYVGPKCDGNNPIVCSTGGFNNGEDGGSLYTVLRRVAAWQEQIKPWLSENKFADNGYWCVPETTAGLSTKEVEIITGNGRATWGSTASVVNCLRWYSAADTGDSSTDGAHGYFKRCQDRLEGYKNAALYVAKFETCKQAMNKAINAQTFLSCKNAINLTLSKANASTQYTACLNEINALKQNASYCATAQTAPPASCQSFSMTATNVAQPSTYDACSTNSAYINWVTQSIAFFGQTRDQYCASPTKPETTCTTSLTSHSGEPSYDVCSGGNYIAWLNNQAASYSSGSVEQICAGTPLTECQNLPASSVVPMPSSCAAPQAYAQWLEDSKASYNNGGTLSQYCAVSPSTPPAECSTATTLPRSIYGAPPPFDVCSNQTTKGSYQQWLDRSMTGNDQQSAAFKPRYDYLNGMYNKFLAASKAMDQFTTDTNAFLAGPVASLLTARQSMNATQVDSIPNSIIYGWKDQDPPKGKSRDGYWHVVQVSAEAPGKLSSIGTKRKGFLGSTRCYFLRDYDGRVKVTVRRWDEDHAEVKFANKLSIWKVGFGRPDRAKPVITSPFQSCIGGNWKKIGLSTNPDTYAQLSSVWGAETSNPTEELLQGAFMMMGKPTSDDSPNQACYDATQELLNSGITTEVCAHYGRDPNTGGIGVYFEVCPSAIP